jgi:hypothetical protein
VRLSGRAAIGAAIAAAAAVSVAPVAGAGAWDQGGTTQQPAPKPVKAPPDGAHYTGNHRLSLYISGKSIQIVAFRFPCKQAKGDTSLQDVKLKKTDKGYKFGITSYGIVTYTDSETHPDQNGQITLAGRFGRLAKTVAGHFRVKTPRCDSGRIDFSGQRAAE